jgi:hypothetical protein
MPPLLPESKDEEFEAAVADFTEAKEAAENSAEVIRLSLKAVSDAKETGNDLLRQAALRELGKALAQSSDIEGLNLVINEAASAILAEELGKLKRTDDPTVACRKALERVFASSGAFALDGKSLTIF